MISGTRQRISGLKQDLAQKKSVDGWILPKQESSWAPPGTWTNKDLDVTPVARRTWTSWTLLGYWVSDIISIQSWEVGSSILAVGLTWKEAVFSIVFGSAVMAVPMTLNGLIGAKTHVPFPVLARASFGYTFSKFPVIIRLITCLFWHAITNFLAVGPMTQVIRSIWPSYRTITNHIPDSAGITTQQMISYTVVWLVQLPMLMIPPHRMRWLFVVKVIATTATIVGMAAWTGVKAGGSGAIWDQKATVSGSTRAWLFMSAINSCTTSWATVGVNIPDFTRYMKSPRSAVTQGIWFPVVCSWVAIIGIVVTSATAVLYDTYLWDPVDIIDKWDGPAGRAAAFFAGASWCIAQICVNISATVISGANDMASLWPKWVNIRRGALITTVIGGWVMVPWKILHSADSLLNFMSSLGVFLAPIMGVQIADFFIVKRMRLDIPALYQPNGRYTYSHGYNWRAVVTMLCAVTPQLPGLAYAVNPKLDIGGAVYIADVNWYFAMVTSMCVYAGLSLAWPAHETLCEVMIDGLEVGGVVVAEEVVDEKRASDGEK